ncbi:MAG: C4-dicarboxylate ABC transporter permease [Gammaproteobacteria bacterium]|nr:MAG: C4-dicarboxylate ABC transporter permease [Gammaproteobacteria bacterium]
MRTFLKFINNLEEIVCNAILAFFVTLMFVQILLRAFFSYSLPWGEELATYLFVWFAYLGAVVAAKMSAHNRVSFQFMFFPPWVKIVSETIADLLWVAFNCYFVWLSYDFVFHRMNTFWKSQTLGLPMKYVYMILPAAFLLMSIRILWNVYLRLRGVEIIDPEQEEIEQLRKENAELQAQSAQSSEHASEKSPEKTQPSAQEQS